MDSTAGNQAPTESNPNGQDTNEWGTTFMEQFEDQYLHDLAAHENVGSDVSASHAFDFEASTNAGYPYAGSSLDAAQMPYFAPNVNSNSDLEFSSDSTAYQGREFDYRSQGNDPSLNIDFSFGLLGSTPFVADPENAQQLSGSYTQDTINPALLDASSAIAQNPTTFNEMSSNVSFDFSGFQNEQNALQFSTARDSNSNESSADVKQAMSRLIASLQGDSAYSQGLLRIEWPVPDVAPRFIDPTSVRVQTEEKSKDAMPQDVPPAKAMSLNELPPIPKFEDVGQLTDKDLAEIAQDDLLDKEMAAMDDQVTEMGKAAADPENPHKEIVQNCLTVTKFYQGRIRLLDDEAITLRFERNYLEDEIKDLEKQKVALGHQKMLADHASTILAKRSKDLPKQRIQWHKERQQFELKIQSLVEQIESLKTAGQSKDTGVAPPPDQHGNKEQSNNEVDSSAHAAGPQSLQQQSATQPIEAFVQQAAYTEPENSQALDAKRVEEHYQEQLSQLYQLCRQELESRAHTHAQELEAKHQELENRANAHAYAQAQNQDLENRLNVHAQELAAKNQELEAKHQELEAKHQELEAKHQQIEKIETQNNLLRESNLGLLNDRTEKRQRLEFAETSLDAAKKLANASEAQAAQLKKSHEKSISDLRKQHSKEIKDKDIEIGKLKARKPNKQEQAHAEAMNQLQADHDAETKSSTEKHAEEIRQLQEMHAKAQKQQKAEHAEILSQKLDEKDEYYKGLIEQKIAADNNETRENLSREKDIRAAENKANAAAKAELNDTISQLETSNEELKEGLEGLRKDANASKENAQSLLEQLEKESEKSNEKDAEIERLRKKVTWHVNTERRMRSASELLTSKYNRLDMEHQKLQNTNEAEVTKHEQEKQKLSQEKNELLKENERLQAELDNQELVESQNIKDREALGEQLHAAKVEVAEFYKMVSDQRLRAQEDLGSAELDSIIQDLESLEKGVDLETELSRHKSLGSDHSTEAIDRGTQTERSVQATATEQQHNLVQSIMAIMVMIYMTIKNHIPPVWREPICYVLVIVTFVLLAAGSYDYVTLTLKRSAWMGSTQALRAELLGERLSAEYKTFPEGVVSMRVIDPIFEVDFWSRQLYTMRTWLGVFASPYLG